MDDIFRRITRLSERYPLVRTFSPADARLVYRSAGKLPGELDPDLRRFYRFSNGASLLDYCIVGCKNSKLADLAENTLSLWPLNNWLAGEFVGFVTTSTGENFGYLLGIEGSGGSHPVGYLQNPTDGSLLILSSSVNMFLRGLVDSIEITLKLDQEALSVDEDLWPSMLGKWFKRDSELVEMYSSGVLSQYFESDPELVRKIRAILEMA